MLDKSIRERYEEYRDRGLTSGEVARLEGVSLPAVSINCKRHGIELKDGRRKKNE